MTILQETLAEIAEKREKTVSQVALNWLLMQDERVIPIPGSTSARHVTENVETLNWQLSAEEFAMIDKASTPWKK